MPNGAITTRPKVCGSIVQFKALEFLQAMIREHKKITLLEKLEEKQMAKSLHPQLSLRKRSNELMKIARMQLIHQVAKSYGVVTIEEELKETEN